VAEGDIANAEKQNSPLQLCRLAVTTHFLPLGPPLVQRAYHDKVEEESESATTIDNKASDNDDYDNCYYLLMVMLWYNED
jgi:hypothetical protein